jgi:N-acetylneuraminic acid mutarotase
MKREIIQTFFLLLLTLYSTAQTFVWTQCSIFSGGQRYSPAAFATSSKAYVGCGVTFAGGNIDYNHNDFWEYDPINNYWTQVANFPGVGRNGSTAFSIGSKGYVTLGWAPAQLNDLWEFDPSSNTWTQKSNFAGAARYDASVFTIGSFAYVGTGYIPWSKDFWKYDPSNDSWTQIADIGGLPRQSCAAFSISGFGYVYGGSQQFNNYSNDLWQYDPTNNTWAQKSPFPGNPRTASFSFIMNGKGYIGCGSNDTVVYDDFYEYEPVFDSWQQVPNFGGGARMQGISFWIGNSGYAGLGSNMVYPNLNPQNDLWKFQDATSINELEHSQFKVYPNPVKDVLTLNFCDNASFKVSILNSMGTEVFKSNNVFHSQKIYMKEFAKGSYQLRILSNSKSYFKTIVKN